MRILLDTHALLWILLDEPRFGASARDLLEDEANELHVSIVSLWEVAIKAAKGRLPTDAAAVDAAVSRGVFVRLGLLPAHVRALATLPSHPDHRDPFDRMLIAQARAEGLTLMTSDAKLTTYGVPTIGTE